MTPLQVELLGLLIKGIIKGCEVMAKVGEMNDEQCLALIPVTQANIDRNDETIMGL